MCSFRSLWLTVAAALFIGGGTVEADAQIVVGSRIATAQAVRPVMPKAWDGKPYYYVKEPSIWLPVVIDARLEQEKDATGTPLAERCREFLIAVGCVSSIGFYEGSNDPYRWRFHYATKSQCVEWSRWDHPGNLPGSGYFAIYPNGKDLYVNNYLKPSQGGELINPVNARRFFGHAWVCSLGWPNQGFPGEGAGSPAMRSPYLSRPENWKSELLMVEGKGGFDIKEIAWLQQWGRKYGGDGTCWIWRDK